VVVEDESIFIHDAVVTRRMWVPEGKRPIVVATGSHQKTCVYRREDGISERALFVIDKDGIIHWSYVSPVGVNPGAHGILNALESLDSEKKKE
jgi:peroxiredoxin